MAKAKTREIQICTPIENILLMTTSRTSSDLATVVIKNRNKLKIIKVQHIAKKKPKNTSKYQT
jgi:hypothetical protein